MLGPIGALAKGAYSENGLHYVERVENYSTC